jgi:hypothetical protein
MLKTLIKDKRQIILKGDGKNALIIVTPLYSRINRVDHCSSRYLHRNFSIIFAPDINLNY